MYSRTVNPSVFLTFSIIVNTIQAHVHADRYSEFLTLLSETGGAIQNLHPLLLQSRRNYSTAALLRKSSRRSYNCSTLTSRCRTEYLKCIYSFYNDDDTCTSVSIRADSIVSQLVNDAEQQLFPTASTAHRHNADCKCTLN